MPLPDRMGGDPQGDEPIKSRKACVNCRRQKMKCRVDYGSSCRRCLRTGVACVFVPRANAASYREAASMGPVVQQQECMRPDNSDVLYRLKRLEEHVGLSTIHNEDQAATVEVADDAINQNPEDSTLELLRPAIHLLRSTCSSDADEKIWAESLIKRLWLTFHDTMFEMHFLPNRQLFSKPTPLLLASMLYCSSIRGSPEVGEFASEYFKVLCSAIAQLCIPGSEIGKDAEDPAKAEEWAFRTILGIILAGLLREGISRETGVWISVAYRLLLEHFPLNVDERSLEWQRLYAGLQIIDLEHAAIHLSCPTIPVSAPFACLRVSLQDQLCRLSRMMHTGLSHFTGRGLPTIWSFFSGETVPPIDAVTPFSDIDGAVIRDWARQLDDWLVDFGVRTDEPDIERKLTFRQYVLHRVLVLSIYLPARGSYIFSNTTLKEQHELLASARAAVKLHLADSSIWANFDLIIIAWAALIVIQGVEGGFGEPDDLEIVQAHLSSIQGESRRYSNLHVLLATRLEEKLQAASTPVFGDLGIHIDGNYDRSWYLFNQSSLQTGYDLLSFEGCID